MVNRSRNITPLYIKDKNIVNRTLGLLIEMRTGIVRLTGGEGEGGGDNKLNRFGFSSLVTCVRGGGAAPPPPRLTGRAGGGGGD